MFEKALKTLRLNREAGMEEVRKAYVKMAQRYPPEHFPEKFKEIKKAYEQLSMCWSALEPLIKNIAYSKTQSQMLYAILQEAIQAAEENDSGEQAVDFWELEPLLNAESHTKELKLVLQEICNEGLIYADGEE